MTIQQDECNKCKQHTFHNFHSKLIKFIKNNLDGNKFSYNFMLQGEIRARKRMKFYFNGYNLNLTLQGGIKCNNYYSAIVRSTRENRK